MLIQCTLWLHTPDLCNNLVSRGTVYKLALKKLTRLSYNLIILFFNRRAIAMDTYGVDSNAINMFSLVFAIFYIPGSIISITLYTSYGISSCVIAGAIFNFLSVWIRCFGAFSFDPTTAYNVMLFGQILAALGQPCLLNASPRY